MENNSDYKKYKVVVGDIIDKNFAMFSNYQDAIQHKLRNLWFGEGRDRTLKFEINENGKKYEGEYVDGQKTGTWKSRNNEHKITSMGQYMNNKKVGLWYECNEHPSEQTCYVGVYLDGV